jgi:hypothetical protein
MAFRISGLSGAPFAHLYGKSDSYLREHNAIRYTDAGQERYPERVGLRATRTGESVLLVNHIHLDVPTPYRSGHAIFVLEGAIEPAAFIDEVPGILRERLLSVRAFDGAGMMVDADVVEGEELSPLLTTLLSKQAVEYLHVHFAKRGCYAARVDLA